MAVAHKFTANCFVPAERPTRDQCPETAAQYYEESVSDASALYTYKFIGTDAANRLVFEMTFCDNLPTFRSLLNYAEYRTKVYAISSKIKSLGVPRWTTVYGSIRKKPQQFFESRKRKELNS